MICHFKMKYVCVSMCVFSEKKDLKFKYQYLKSDYLCFLVSFLYCMFSTFNINYSVVRKAIFKIKTMFEPYYMCFVF